MSSQVTPDSSSATEDVDQGLEIIRVNHDEAFLYVSQGLSYQEQNEFLLAADMYHKGQEKIDKALNVRCDRPHCVGPKWDAARKMQQKMRKTLQMIQSQLQELNSKKPLNLPHKPVEPSELPPSYDEACKQESFSRRASCPNPLENEVCKNNQLDDLNGNLVTNASFMKTNDDFVKEKSAEVVELFKVPGEVQLFFVSSDGSVSASSHPSSLHIYQFVDDASCSADTSRPPAWLQVGSWTYPLIPGQSPSLESGYGAFLFPDVTVGQPGSAVAVIFPSSVDQCTRRTFERILSDLTAFEEEKRIVPASLKRHAETESTESFSDTLSRGLVTGAEYLSAGLVKGASLTSDLIQKGASKVKERLSPEDKPVSVDPRVREGLKLARDASGAALKVSGFLVKKLGELTVSLGKQLAPHVHSQGSKVLTNAFNKKPEEAKQTMDSVLTVAAGGLQGFSTVFMGLENAARTLAYSLSSETVSIVDHKYGGEAGEVVGNAVYAVGNLALTTYNVQNLGAKAIAKRTAKDTGKAVLKDYVENIEKNKHEEKK